MKTPRGHHFLRLHQRAGVASRPRNRHQRTHAKPVASFAREPDGQVPVLSLGFGVVAVNRSGLICVVHHQIQVTVIIQVSVGRAGRNGSFGQAPLSGYVVELKPIAVAEGGVVCFGGGKFCNQVGGSGQVFR